MSTSIAAQPFIPDSSSMCSLGVHWPKGKFVSYGSILNKGILVLQNDFCMIGLSQLTSTFMANL